MQPPTELDRFRGALLGLAAGDALGTTVEFKPRGSFTPLTDMIGGGPFGLKAGEWTDDTSMALCLAESLLECGRLDPNDQMDRYVRWWKEGYWSSNGRCFDIGMTVRSALQRYIEDGKAFAGSRDPHSAGNGSIMRLAPVPMRWSHSPEIAVELSGESSRTTHGARECVDACRLLGAIIMRGLNGGPKGNLDLPERFLESLCPKILEIARHDYRQKTESEISGSGYVVKSLEAALWCFDRTDDFRSAILMAANLGDDADTTAAVCGQIAGAYYGASGIPPEWLDQLAKREQIQQLADRLFERANAA